jgi:predicted PurR-regulated permease PerM
MSIFTSLTIVLGVMMTVGCYIIPCIRRLSQRLIKTALTKETPISYQNSLLVLDIMEHESQLMLRKFEEKNTDKLQKEGEIVGVRPVFSVKVTLSNHCHFESVSILVSYTLSLFISLYFSCS